jgi:hypothetical protein
MSEPRILHLNLVREFFDAVATGAKTAACIRSHSGEPVDGIEEQVVHYVKLPTPPAPAAAPTTVAGDDPDKDEQHDCTNSGVYNECNCSGAEMNV